MSEKPMTAPEFVALKGVRKVAWITAYAAWQARLVEQAGMDGILVGDSLGNTELGHSSTLPVTMEDMVRHTQAVRRGAPRSFIVGDMPFLSYSDRTTAILNAGRLIKEAGAQAVKLEGDARVAPIVESLTNEGIPVMGHIGLRPQQVQMMGGYRVQGRLAEQALGLVNDARAIAQAGAFSVVLEGIPDRIAGAITESIPIPTIGIGAGPLVDAQILVFHDSLGISERLPKFARDFGGLGPLIARALADYRDSVESQNFPQTQEGYHITEEEWRAFLERWKPTSS